MPIMGGMKGLGGLGGSTVADRLKTHGYIMGPQHRMGPAMEDAATDAPDTGGDDQGPPNLRDASDGPDDCSGCGNYDGETCNKFDVPVTSNQVCDNFEQKGTEPNGEENASPAPEEG